MRPGIRMALFASVAVNVILGLRLAHRRNQATSGAARALNFQTVPPSIKLDTDPAGFDQLPESRATERLAARPTIDLPWSIAREVVDHLPCDGQLRITDDFAALLAMTPDQRKELQAAVDREVHTLRKQELNSAQDIADADGRRWKRIPPHNDVRAAAHEKLISESVRILGSEAGKIFCDRLLGQSILKRDGETLEVSLAPAVDGKIVLNERTYDTDELMSVSEYQGNPAVEWRYKHLFPELNSDGSPPK